MTMNELIMKAREKKCSDIHISEGMPVSFRIHGQLLDSGFSFPAAETREMILSMLSDEQREQLEQHHSHTGTAANAESAAGLGRPAKRTDSGDRPDGKR